MAKKPNPNNLIETDPKAAGAKGGSATSLNYRQQLFCQEYLKDFNTAAAARRAGYSQKTATNKGYLMLRNPLIQAELDRLQNRREVRTQITTDEILKRLMRIANEAETERDFNVALRALELLGKNKAMFTDKNITTIERNPFSSGEDTEAVERDARRLTGVIRAGAAKSAALKIIEGGKSEDYAEEYDEDADFPDDSDES